MGPGTDLSLGVSDSPLPRTSLLRVLGVLATEEVLRIRDGPLEGPAQAHEGCMLSSREEPCLQEA